MVSSDSGWEEMAVFCEHGNELSDCIKSEVFLDRGRTLVSVGCRQIACKRRKPVSTRVAPVSTRVAPVSTRVAPEQERLRDSDQSTFTFRHRASSI